MVLRLYYAFLYSILLFKLAEKLLTIDLICFATIHSVQTCNKVE